jgi:hypothetical protein
VRWVPNIPVDRARVRTTLTYQTTDRLRLGLEYNPQANDLGLLANYRALDETATRPALIFGTSSARIGTDDGRALYATLSKDLSHWLDVPIAPYAGVSFDGADHRFRGIGGVSVRYTDEIGSMHFYDGVNIHHTATWSRGGGSIGLLLAEIDGDHYLGVSCGMQFGG